MNQTLYFALPDIASAEQVVHDLLGARIASPNIHCVASRGSSLDDLPESGVLQKAQFLPIAGVGLTYGAMLGWIVGGLMVLFPPPETHLYLATLPVGAIVGAAIGACISMTAGVLAPNSRIAALERAAAEGTILLTVDVPFSRALEIAALVQSRQAQLHAPSANAIAQDDAEPPIRLSA
ncbi:MAG TPA: hypothetical protein VHB46_17470 [Burkholderiales bacterium]|nr:hypothetical protein [Burkholderiales bacterium]